MKLMNKIRFLNPTWHGLLDYSAAMALVVLPAILNIGEASPLALGISVTTGVTLLTYSLMTDYRYGLFPVFSYRLHIIFDLVAAVGLALVPLLFGFAGLLAGYFWFMAGGVVVVVALSAPSNELFPRNGSPAGRFSELQK